LIYRDGMGVAADEPRGTLLVEKSCHLGNQLGCGELGLSYLEGIGIAADTGKALGLLRHACLEGIGISCSNLGTVYNNGKLVRQDLALARRLFAMGCSAREVNADACFNRADMEAAGVGGPKNTKAATDGYRAACERGMAEACARERTQGGRNPKTVSFAGNRWLVASRSNGLHVASPARGQR
jgi:uncharacterized protein